MSAKMIYWLDEITSRESLLVGSKCAKLGEMLRMGLQIPPGFAITIETYRRFSELTGVQAEISAYMKRYKDIDSIRELNEISRAIRTIIEEKDIPSEIKEVIVHAYHTLSEKIGISECEVAVRSSGIAEDLEEASFAGQYESYLNVKGESLLINRVKKVWSSAFTPRAISYRIKNNISINEGSIGVGVIKMVNARAAGVAFSVDPIRRDASKIIIEGNWGLGEGVVSGESDVDRFVLDKESLEILEQRIGYKSRGFIRKMEGAGWEDTPEEIRSAPCINSEEVKEIAKLTKTVEERIGSPQDVEWAIDSDLLFPENIFLLQTRPVTVKLRKEETITDKMIDLMSKTIFKI